MSLIPYHIKRKFEVGLSSWGQVSLKVTYIIALFVLQIDRKR